LRPESLAHHDSAAPIRKGADYGVFLPGYRPSVADNSGFLWNSPATRETSLEVSAKPRCVKPRPDRALA
jgi:hypothetical protein